jgi:single-stranded-DNA-specific exonuclease
MIKRWTIKETSHDFWSAERFIELQNKQSSEIHDPFLMKDMKKAVDLIKEALVDGTKITVYGDYDCDGITATVMLYSHLSMLGGEVDWYIPSREEGYGLNTQAIEKIIAGGTKLIITVDNGVSAFPEIDFIKEKGISIIITDHHTVPEKLPNADAIVNPKQSDCKYPFKELAGCGVVLKLIAALENADSLYAIEQYGDLAAIGTIADIVPLENENKLIVLLGLQNFEYSENLGIYSLMKKTGLSEKVTENGIDSTSIAFVLCPRINAAGRFAHPGKAVELLLCENHELAMTKAEELNSLNQQRIDEERVILAEIDTYLENNPQVLNERVLFLYGKDWHHGIIGIICSRMVTRFGKPCAILTTDGITAKGSCRSVKGFSVVSALTYCEDLLVKFGGHSGAGGLSVLDENILQFKEKLLSYAGDSHEMMPMPEIIADTQPTVDLITIENIERLDTLRPFGEGNPIPVFLLTDCVIKYKRPLKEGKYVSFTVGYENRELKILDFSHTYSDFWYRIGDSVDLMLNLNVNEYNGSKNVSMKVVDIRLSKITSLQERYFAAKDTYEKITREEEIDEKLYSRIIPDNEAMKSVYNIIRTSFCLDEVVQRALKSQINYCMLRVAIDVFEEMKLIQFNRATESIKTVNTVEKANLEDSTVLIKLKERL